MHNFLTFDAGFEYAHSKMLRAKHLEDPELPVHNLDAAFNECYKAVSAAQYCVFVASTDEQIEKACAVFGECSQLLVRLKKKVT